MRNRAGAIAMAVALGYFPVAGSLAWASRTNKAGTEPWNAQSAFDVTVKTLPASFAGNTVEWALRYGTLAPKYHLETDDEYGQRRRSFRSETFAFVLDKYNYSYDGKTQTATVTVLPILTRLGGEPGTYLVTFNVARDRLPPTSRAGPARETQTIRPTVLDRGPVTVTRRVWKQSQIVVAGPSPFKVGHGSLVFRLRIPPDRARHARSNIRVALVCVPTLEQYRSIGDPVVPEATGSDFAGAKPGEFTDEEITYYLALRAELIQIWLFDNTTGEVYMRLSELPASIQ